MLVAMHMTSMWNMQPHICSEALSPIHMGSHLVSNTLYAQQIPLRCCGQGKSDEQDATVQTPTLPSAMCCHERGSQRGSRHTSVRSFDFLLHLQLVWQDVLCQTCAFLDEQTPIWLGYAPLDIWWHWLAGVPLDKGHVDSGIKQCLGLVAASHFTANNPTLDSWHWLSGPIFDTLTARFLPS